jgi:hypothetical protein
MFMKNSINTVFPKGNGVLQWDALYRLPAAILRRTTPAEAGPEAVGMIGTGTGARRAEWSGRSRGSGHTSGMARGQGRESL